MPGRSWRPALRCCSRRSLSGSGRRRGIELMRRNIGSASATALRLISAVGLFAASLVLLGLICAVAALRLAVDRRRAAVELGAGAAAAGVLLIVGWTVGRSLAVNAV